MHLEEGNLYHVFNRGNNKQNIFFERRNYIFFLEKVNLYLKPNCEILAWCLMPNHFHFLIYANNYSVKVIRDGSFGRQQFSQSIKQLLSSYTKAINKSYSRSGSLFQQKTKAVCLLDSEDNHPSVALHYIHQNPMKSGLVSKMEDWEFSSFQDYNRLRPGKLCNLELANKYLNIDLATFYADSYKVINYNSMPAE
jgi:REP element-mobilizing transposase RayT